MKNKILPIGLAIFVVSVIITLNYFLEQNYEAEMAGQFNKQQLHLATTISANLESNFKNIQDELVSLARRLGRKGGRFTGRDIMDSPLFVALRESELRIKVFDAKGAIVYTDDGQTKADSRDYPLLAKTKQVGPGGICSSDRVLPGGAIRLFTPVMDGSKWEGAVELDLNLEPVNRKYIVPVRSGLKGYTWMMRDDGMLLYHPTQPNMVGRNLHEASPECFGCHKSFRTELWILHSGQTGSSSYISPRGEDKLIAFSKFVAFDHTWIVCESIPYSEVTMSLRKSLRLHSILILAIFGAAVFGAVTVVVANQKRLKAEEKARHEEELEKYAVQLEKSVADRTKELYAEKEKLNTIVNAMGGGLILTDVNGKILWANRQFVDLVRLDNINGDMCEDLGREAPELGALSDRVETRVVEGLFGWKGRYFQVTSAPVKSEGEIIGFIRLMQDITEMKKMQEQMLHSEKLTALGRLSAGISHEIGNPLTAVFSFLQILKERIKDDFNKESLETIIFHMKRIAETVRQLSSLSKVPAPELKRVKINSVLRQTIELIKYDKRTANIRIEENFEDIPEFVTDENRLSQVFINLLLNAVDAMPGGGALTINCKALQGRVVVEVQDTGAGIPGQNLSRIFDPFFTTKEKGTGLGLSVSYSIIKGLGGEIKVDSSPGAGSKFTVILPDGRLDDADKNPAC